MTNSYIENILKNLQTLEVFEYYDSPILYSAITKTGQIYLAWMISTGHQTTSWYYVELSPDRYRSIRSGNISIRDAFRGAESGLIINCVVNDDSSLTIAIKDAKTLPEDKLPSENERLSLTETWLPRQTVSTTQSAQSLNRQVLDIFLNSGDDHSHVSVDRIGSILVNVQAITDALACDQSQSVYRIPEYLRGRNRLYPTAIFSGSFGVRIITDDESELTVRDDEHALFRLVRLLDESKDLETLGNAFKNLNLLTRSRFLRFLRGLSEHELSIGLDWANRQGHVARTSIQLTRIKINITYLEQTVDSTKEIRETPGILEMVNAVKSTFEFKENSGEYLRGKIDKNLLANLKAHEGFFRVPYPIVATLKQEMKVNPITGEEMWGYVLLDYKLPDGIIEQS